ncbi:ATP-binding protein [Flammeovirga sp. SJP92]|uniref:ATP-binding protein n=1 Tax=Flammeovirga sp. SJP92 TaxID=1775430 RepID=UPI0007896439|nr:ATP-binding protein [Flammeovirga sp. SJP92]KXX66688.1 hypothetical protein AVL50_31085 [Flammeovirga sp. SJP92]
MSIEKLKAVPTFEGVPEDQLQWLLNHGELKTFKDKEPMFRPGDPAEYLFVVFEGEFRTYIFNDKGKKYMDSFGVNTVSGVLPFSRIKEFGMLCHSCGESTIFRLHRDLLGDMIRHNYELTECLVHTMTTRVREFAKVQTQNEKLMALGKMSAGLAHELNNPASAMARSGKELKKHLSSVPERFKAVMSMNVNEEEIDHVNTFIHQKLTAPKTAMTLIEKSNLEDDLTDFLEDKGMEDVDDIVGALVDFQIQEEDLEEMYDELGDQNFASTLGWVGSQLITEKMVQDISEASERISSLITSIKSFSYMDRSQDMQKMNVHEGLQSTVKLLEHKIQKQGHQLDMKLAPNLPEIDGMPGELNQVWMNILANGIDALEEKGTIGVRTAFDDENVKIYLTDTGKGIPEEIRSRIFEPFFTTKGIGKGTGLGLDITKKIIDKHEGTIKVTSQPGNTEFRITLPIKSNIE